MGTPAGLLGAPDSARCRGEEDGTGGTARHCGREPMEHQVLPPPPAVPARSRQPTCAAGIAGPQAEVLTYLLLFHHAPVHPLALSSGSTPGEGLPAPAPGRAARSPLTAARDLRARGGLRVCAPPSSQGWNWGSSFCYFPSDAPGTWLAFRAASVRKNQRWPDGLMD